MGKGRRRTRTQERPAYLLLRERAAAQDTVVRVLCAVALFSAILTLLMPTWSLSVIERNLAAESYTAEESATLSDVLPLGQLAIGLTAVGILATSVLLWLRKAPASLLSLSVALAGNVLLVIFTVTISDVFAYDDLEQRGLAFRELLTRYYAALLPAIVLIPTACVAFSARKKRALADLMERASDSTPTITLGSDTDLHSSSTPFSGE